MELNQRIDELEGELKIVKNEVQSVLLDIRERVLSYYDNPFQTAVVNAPPKKGPEMASTVTTNVAGEAPAGRPLNQAGDHQSNGDSKMEEEAGTSQLKGLMDQLEREREALKREQQVAHSPSPGGAQSAQPPLPTQPYHDVPQFQPAQSVPQFQPAQALPPAPRFGPSLSDYHPPERDRRQRPAETERGDTGDDQRPSPGPGSDPRGRMGAEEESTRGAGRRTVRRSPGSPRPEERGMDRHDEAADVEREELQDWAPNGDQTEVNLLTLVGLVRWAEKSTSKIGKERVEAVVEIYQTAGCLPTSYKEIIPQIIRLADGEKPEAQPTMGDSLNVLLQLDSLLGKKFKTQAAILSTLFGDDGGYPWIKQ
ncbi:hypothetical protein M1N87_01565 [Dehalococcoidia bacterium]|nr:hypothetical protein [Dehalococcoidia bacterium]